MTNPWNNYGPWSMPPPWQQSWSSSPGTSGKDFRKRMKQQWKLEDEWNARHRKEDKKEEHKKMRRGLGVIEIAVFLIVMSPVTANMMKLFYHLMDKIAASIQ